MSDQKMDPEIKVKWLEALRSGEYKKSVGHLKDNWRRNGYCCLGVLCEVAVKDGVIKKVPMKEERDSWKSRKGSYLPRRVAKWAGISDVSSYDSSLEGTHQANLAELNDSSTTFDSVIQYIEEKM